MKPLEIKRRILRQIGVEYICHRPGCGEIVRRGEAVFIHKGCRFCCRFCVEAYDQGQKFNTIRRK